MNAPADLMIVSDCINEAEALCQGFENAGLSTAMALGPVSAAQTIRLTNPRLVLIVRSHVASDDASAVLSWLRGCSDSSIYACLIPMDSTKGSAHYKQAGFDFCFRLPLSEQVINALAESVKAVRSLASVGVSPQMPVHQVDVDLTALACGA